MSRYTGARSACADLDAIWGYVGIENRNPDAADWLLETLREKFALLASYPFIGEARPDLADLIPNVRSFSVGDYVIYYQPQPGGVRIGRVLHGARDVRTALG
jgi:toxin ParE1/3/4